MQSSLTIIKNKLDDKDKVIQMVDLSAKELHNLQTTLSGILEIQKLTNSKTFENSYYCSLKEIIEEAQENITLPQSFNLYSDLDDKNLFFVNKYHFTKIFQKLINFIVDTSPNNESKIEIKSKINPENRSIQIIIENCSAIPNTDYANTVKSILESKGKSAEKTIAKSETVGIKVAKKIIDLYNGNVAVQPIDDNKLTITLSFRNLMSKVKAS